MHQFPVRSQGSLLVPSISDGFATGAYAQRALRAGLPGRFSRVARSCSLLEMGTFPFLVSERLQLTANLQQRTFLVLTLGR